MWPSLFYDHHFCFSFLSLLSSLVYLQLQLLTRVLSVGWMAALLAQFLLFGVNKGSVNGEYSTYNLECNES